MFRKAFAMKNLLFLIFFLFSTNIFANEFDKYCTTSLADGVFHKTDCSVKSTFDGKDYCFGNQVAMEIFLEDPKPMLEEASSFFKKSNEDFFKLFHDFKKRSFMDTIYRTPNGAVGEIPGFSGTYNINTSYIGNF